MKKNLKNNLIKVLSISLAFAGNAVGMEKDGDESHRGVSATPSRAASEASTALLSAAPSMRSGASSAASISKMDSVLYQTIAAGLNTDNTQAFLAMVNGNLKSPVALRDDTEVLYSLTSTTWERIANLYGYFSAMDKTAKKTVIPVFADMLKGRHITVADINYALETPQLKGWANLFSQFYKKNQETTAASRLQGEVTTLRDQIELQKTAIGRTTDELKAVQIELDAQKALAATLQNAQKAKSEELDLAKAALAEAEDKSERDQATITRLTEAKRTTQLSSDEATAALDEATTKLNAITAAKARKDKAFDELNTEKTALESRADNLDAQLKASHKKVQTLEQQMRTIAEELEAAQAEVERTQEGRAASHARHEAAEDLLKRETNDLRAQLTEARKINTKLEAERAGDEVKYQEALSLLKEQIASATAEHAEQLTAIKLAHEGQMTRLNEALSAAQAQLDGSPGRQRGATQAQVDEHARLEAEVTKLKAELEWEKKGFFEKLRTKKPA